MTYSLNCYQRYFSIESTRLGMSRQVNGVTNMKTWKQVMVGPSYLLVGLECGAVFLNQSRQHKAKKKTKISYISYYFDKINHDIYPGNSTHREVVFREVLHPNRITIWKCWFLGKTGVPNSENSEQSREPTTNSTHI